MFEPPKEEKGGGCAHSYDEVIVSATQFYTYILYIVHTENGAHLCSSGSCCGLRWLMLFQVYGVATVSRIDKITGLFCKI